MKLYRLGFIMLVSLILAGCVSNRTAVPENRRHFVIDDVMMTPVLEECFEDMNSAILNNWPARKTKPSLLINECYDKRFGEGKVTVISHWIQEKLYTDFIETKSYKIIDREDIERLRNEKKFQQAGYVDDKVMVDEGRELGGNYLIAAEISEFDTFDVKVTNLESAEIIYKVSKLIKEGTVK